ncbi:MAG: exodeoxyribonuclease III [Acidimicrobiales bacterium]
MRIATWNVNSLKARLPRVEGWLAEIRPDVLCMQETKLSDDAFPALAFRALGYDAVYHGGGRWNGVAILSRVGLSDPANGFAGDDPVPSTEARLISATCGPVRVATLYVPNGRSPEHEQFQMKLAWLARLRRHLDACEPSENLLLCGDFNIASDDRDVYDPAKYIGATHVTPAERGALADIEAWGLVDVFRQRHEEGGLFTWWDYRAGNFHKHLGMRIDLMLATASLADRLEWILVDRNARKGQGPSDHAPIVAEFDI